MCKGQKSVAVAHGVHIVKAGSICRLILPFVEEQILLKG